jgi:flagellar biosynthesis GTPase FlhF
MLLSAAKSPLSRQGDLRFVHPELDGAGAWIMAYNKPTSLRVPLSSVMEWSGKRTFTDIFKEDPRFETKKLGNTNELTANIYFAWKPDSLQIQEEEEEEEEAIEEAQELASAKRAKKGKKSGKQSSRPFLESPEKRKRAVGTRTRRQAQLEEEDIAQPEPREEEETLVKEEKDTDNDLPDINNIISGRS